MLPRSQYQKVRRINVPYVIIFAAVVLVWLPSIFDGLIWDDYVSVLLAPQRWHIWNLRDYFLPLDPHAVYLRPLPPLTFYLDQVLWGTNYWGWHLDNVLLHGLNAVMVAAIAMPLGRFGSVAAALAFGLHPVLTEPVSWISARPDLLATFFLLLSFWCFTRGYRLPSLMAFSCALLSKEAAVVFAPLISGWLLFQRRPIKESYGCWLVFGGYWVYRFLALHGFRSNDWSPDLLSAAWRPWFALVYPLPIQMPGWPSPGNLPAPVWWGAALVCTAILRLVILSGRRTLVLLPIMLLMILPVLPVFQLGPSFQFGRYLYASAVIWGFLVGVTLARRFPWRAGLLAAYLIAFLFLNIPARAQFHEVGATGQAVVDEVARTLPQVRPGALIWIEDVPADVNGWRELGGYLELAVNRAYGYEYDRDAPAVKVIDASWASLAGKKLEPPRRQDFILAWNGQRMNSLTLEEWAGHYLAAADRGIPYPPDLPVQTLDFGTDFLSLFQAAGFRWNENDGTTTWNWATQPRAELKLPVNARLSARLRLRLMSAVDNEVTIRVNGVMIGQASIPGGYAWQNRDFDVPEAVWRDEPYQVVSFEFTSDKNGSYVAFDRMDIEPSRTG